MTFISLKFYSQLILPVNMSQFTKRKQSTYFKHLLLSQMCPFSHVSFNHTPLQWKIRMRLAEQTHRLQERTNGYQRGGWVGREGEGNWGVLWLVHMVWGWGSHREDRVAQKKQVVTLWHLIILTYNDFNGVWRGNWIIWVKVITTMLFMWNLHKSVYQWYLNNN